MDEDAYDDYVDDDVGVHASVPERRRRAAEIVRQVQTALAAGSGAAAAVVCVDKVWSLLPPNMKVAWYSGRVAPSDLRRILQAVTVALTAERSARAQAEVTPATGAGEPTVVPPAFDLHALMAASPHGPVSVEQYKARKWPAPRAGEDPHPYLLGDKIIEVHMPYCHCKDDPSKPCAGAALAALVSGWDPVDTSRVPRGFKHRRTAYPPRNDQHRLDTMAMIKAHAKIAYIMRGEPSIDSPPMCVYRKKLLLSAVPEDAGGRKQWLRDTVRLAVKRIKAAGSRVGAGSFEELAFRGLFAFKPRIVADCSSKLNEFVNRWPMYYAGPMDIAAAMTPGCVMATRDVKGAYIHIRLSEKSRHLVGFHDLEGKGWVYDGAVMGIKTACAAFSAVSAFVIDICRSRGLPAGVVIVPCIDDFTFVAPDAEAMKATLAVFDQVCADIGLCIDKADEKNCDGATRIVALGIEFNSETLTVGLPADKLLARELDARLLRACVQAQIPVPLGLLESFAGKMMHVASIYPQLRQYARSLYAVVSLGQQWVHLWKDSHSCLVSARSAIDGIVRAFVRGDLARQRVMSGEPRQVVAVASDASGTTAWGCTVGTTAFWGSWSEAQQRKSIAYKELWPVLQLLRHYTSAAGGSAWVGKVVHLATDNLPNVFNICRMSCSGDAEGIMASISRICAAHNVVLTASWLPREFNTTCDALSKCPSLPAALAYCSAAGLTLQEASAAG